MKLSLSIKKLFRPLYVPIASWYYDTFRGPKRYHHLFDTVGNGTVKNILEIGVWNGKRAVKMLEIAKRRSADVSYFGFDLFEDLGAEGYKNEFSKMPPTQAEVENLISKTGAKVTLYRGNTLVSLPNAVPTLPPMDFIFIDGGHSIETIASDWKYTQMLMHDETVVIFDDYWRNREDAGCKTTVDAIDRAKYHVEVLPEIDSFDNPDFGHLDISFAKVTKKQ